ncbi:MAG: ParA family protein [Mariniphaga sp.]
MKTISFISAKGGSGKTIIIASIANFLGNLEKRVLIIDSDGSTNGMTLFYLKEIKSFAENNKDCFGVLEDSFDINSVKYTPISSEVFLLPATYEFLNTDNFSAHSFEQHLSSIIQYHKHSINDTYDYILIDSQAGADIHSEIVIKETISDEVIIVSELDPISAAGIERLKGLFPKDLIYNRTWILLNKILPEFAYQSNTDFLEINRYLPPIIWTADVVRKYARKELAFDFESGNEYTLNLVKVLKIFLGKEIKTSLDIWLNSREEIIKKPIYDEYLKLQDEYYEMQKSEKTELYSSNMFLIAAITGLISSLLSIIWLQKSHSSVIKSIFGLDNIWFFGLFALMLGTFTISIINLFNKKKQLSSNNMFRKEVLRESLKELELLKHSNIEKILRSDRKDLALSSLSLKFKLKQKGEIIFEKNKIIINDDAKKQKVLMLSISGLVTIFGVLTFLRYLKGSEPFMLWSGLFYFISSLSIPVIYLLRSVKSEILRNEIKSLEVKSILNNKILVIKLISNKSRQVTLDDNVNYEKIEQYIRTYLRKK